MCRFEVVIKKWNEEQKKVVEVVAGRFDQFIHAKIFAEAYRNWFKSDPQIIEYRKV